MAKHYIEPTGLEIHKLLSSGEVQTEPLGEEQVFSFVDALQICRAVRNSGGSATPFYKSVRRINMPWSEDGEVDNEDLGEGDDAKLFAYQHSVGAPDLWARLHGYENWEAWQTSNRVVRSQGNGDNPAIEMLYDYFDITRRARMLLIGNGPGGGFMEKDWSGFVMKRIPHPEASPNQTPQDCNRRIFGGMVKDVKVETGHLLTTVVRGLWLRGGVFEVFPDPEETKAIETNIEAVLQFARDNELPVEKILDSGMPIV